MSRVEYENRTKDLIVWDIISRSWSCRQHLTLTEGQSLYIANIHNEHEVQELRWHGDFDKGNVSANVQKINRWSLNMSIELDLIYFYTSTDAHEQSGYVHGPVARQMRTG